jgi:hypothetical protein
MNSEQAKKIHLPSLLEKLGHKPVQVTKGGNEYWFLSPFREETAPSFHTSYKGGKWIWKDFGDIGGTVIDFVMRYKGFFKVSDALQFLDENYQGQISQVSSINPNQSGFFTRHEPEENPVLELKNISPLKKSWPYVKGRGITEQVAKTYLVDVEFANLRTDKVYFAAGIKNLSNGFEIRNPFFKSSIGKKDISFIKGEDDSKTISVFEGFMDFLSYLTEERTVKAKEDILILNSLSFQQQAKLFIENGNYQQILTFLDNDRIGNLATQDFSEHFSNKVSPQNFRYQKFRDFNDKVQQGISRSFYP